MPEKTLSIQGEVIDLWYSGKAHTHGGNIQAVSAPDGFRCGVSAVEPGSVHDITTARIHAPLTLYRAAAAQAPGDWANYFLAAFLFLFLSARWPGGWPGPDDSGSGAGGLMLPRIMSALLISWSDPSWFALVMRV